jgi:hypothetical protein
MENKIVKTGWAVITPTICDGDVLSWATYDENDVALPLVYETKEAAWKEIAENMIEVLQQFIDDERDLEDTDFATDDDVYMYEQHEDGTIIVKTEEGGIVVQTTLQEWRANR